MSQPSTDESPSEQTAGTMWDPTANSATESPPQVTPPAGFQSIRVIRTLAGAIVLIALLLNLGGATQRVTENPELAGLALAAIAQLIQKEDIETITETLSGKL